MWEPSYDGLLTTDLCVSCAAAVWPYNGKRYTQMFPPLPQQPQQQSPHMPPPVPPQQQQQQQQQQQMPPPPAYEENPEAAAAAAAAAARGGFIYYPPYPYPPQVGFVSPCVVVLLGSYL